MSAPPASGPALPTDERAALSRLEDLGDHLERDRRRRDAPAPVARGRRGDDRAHLLRSNLIVASGTTMSRLSGLVRVIVFAYVIGRGALADAYLIGNETPNVVYELLLGGVLSATLVPLFTEFVQHDDDEATDVVMTMTVIALAVVTAVAVLAAPLIFGLYTVRSPAGVDGELFQRVGTLLTRVFLVQIFFYGVAGVANAALNARRRFLAAAWSPVLANLVVIVTLLSLPTGTWQLADVETDSRLRWTLALGSTAGIAVMALVLVPALRRAGVSLRIRFRPGHPAVRRLLTLSLWTFGYVVCNQIVVVVVRNLSSPGSGDTAAYLQAFTFFVLPHGLLAMSIATTFVPELARAVGARDRAAFCRTSSLGTRLIALLTVPAAAMLFVLRRPLIGLLLENGEYTSADALVTSRALAGFAPGLVAFSVYLFTLRGFYAHQDTKTPFVVNAGQCALNVVFALVLYGRWGVLGLGAAFALSYLVAALWSLRVLAAKVRTYPLRAVLGSIARMALAGILAAEAAWWVARRVGGNAGGEAFARLLAGSITVLAVYAAVLFVLDAPELTSLRRLRGGDRSPSPPPPPAATVAQRGSGAVAS